MQPISLSQEHKCSTYPLQKLFYSGLVGKSSESWLQFPHTTKPLVLVAVPFGEIRWFGESVPVQSEEWESARSLARSLVQPAGEWVQARALVLGREQAEELGQVQVLVLVLALVSVRDWVRGRGLALGWEFVVPESVEDRDKSWLFN
jgi:hypothetical protein